VRTNAPLGGLVLLVVLGAGRAVTWAEETARERGAITHLEVLTGPRAKTQDPAQATAPERPLGVTLVLNSLSDAARTELASALGRLATEIRRKRNPLFVPLDEGSARTLAESSLRDLGPALTAAASLSVGRWASSDREMTVRGVRSCARGAVCVALGGSAATGDLEARARFLAWPIGFAVVVRSAGPRDAARIATAVRDARKIDSRVALVLTSDELHSLRSSPAVVEIARHAAEIAGAGAGETLAPLLAAIADSAQTHDEVPWLSLPRNTILMVPRLGTLATADAFVGEVAGLLERCHEPVTWLMSPRPTAGGRRP
jgi:hypothetical protein